MPNKFTSQRLSEWVEQQAKNWNSDECLLWPYGTNEHGYGIVRLPNKTAVKVHRLAFYTVHGRWPEPCALHSCDIPQCFNVRHLFEGTQLENIADCNAKGRADGGSMKGEAHPNAELTAELVRKLRAEYVKGKVTQKFLANKYGLTRAVVCDVVMRRSWQHVG